jgi:hypothetical protein
MKSNNLLKTIVMVSSLALMTGCSDNKDKGGTTNPGGGGGGGGSGTAPANVSNKLLTVQVSSGTPVFKDHGSYTFLSDNGAGNSGTYHIVGDGNIPSNIGTFTYHKIADNTGELTEVEESGTVVHNILTFDSATSGSIRSDIPSGANPNGGVQTGTFTLEDVGGTP